MNRASLPFGLKWFACLLAWSLAGAALAAPDQVDAPLPRIAIMATSGGPNGAAFTIKGSGIPLLLKGFDYIRASGADCSTFNAATRKYPAYYEPQHAEESLALMQAHGFNIVRVFINGHVWGWTPDGKTDANHAIAGNMDTQGVYGPYIDNVCDFLRRARSHGIYVLPTFGDGSLPDNRYYQAMLNSQHQDLDAIYFTKEGIAAKARYVGDFLNAIKSKDPGLMSTMMGVECQNELNIRADQWPFKIKTGKLLMPNGKTYNMADPRQRWAMMNEGLRFYHQAIAHAVKEVDPELLVAESVYPLAANNKSPNDHHAYGPPDLVNLGGDALDFLDIHYYRKATETDWARSFHHQMHSSRLDDPAMLSIRQTKPVILGEFGAFRGGRHYYYVEPTPTAYLPDMVQVRDLALAAGLKGVLYWTYDTASKNDMYTAMEHDGALMKALAEPARPGK